MVSRQLDQLDHWQEAIHTVRQECAILARDLSPEQFNWRPAPGKWSVGECFNHLAIATSLLLDNVKPVVERGHADGVTGTPPFRYQMFGGWFVRKMEKPPGRRPMPTPKNFIPPSGIPKDEVMARFDRAVEALQETIARSRGLALDKLRTKSAGEGGSWLKFNLAVWYAATVAHLQRHLAQARRVMQSKGFPGGSAA